MPIFHKIDTLFADGIIFTIKVLITLIGGNNMFVKNPVLKGFNPDPSLVRVKDDYYIATSTFEWFPGVCIHHSKDLVNWTIISYALTDEGAVNMTGIDMSCGIWAPNLTYSNGCFYLTYSIVYTNRSRFKDTHNFLITAENICGPWSDPIPLSRSGFDPSILHDDNGKKYLVNMTMDYREKKYRFSGVDVQEYDEIGQKLIGNPIRVFRGTDRGTTEGPNIFKHKSYYYLVCAEGGTGFDHCVTVLRSESVFGPYEECPFNPILTSKGKADCELQRAGHAQIIEGWDGSWYMAHLCSRPLQGYSILGRETGIQNIVWTKDQWFRLESNEDASPELYFEVPYEIERITEPSGKVDFYKEGIPLDYMTLRRSFSTNGIAIVDKKLRIKGGCSLSSKYQQGLLARRQQSFNCDFIAAIKFEPRHMNHLAGLIVYYNYDNYFHLRITRDEEGKTLNVTRMVNKNLSDGDVVLIPEDTSTYYLKAEIRNEEVNFYYALDNQTFIHIGTTGDMKYISDEHIEGNGFTGAMLGVNCEDLQGDGVFADFLYLEYIAYDEK
jgi:xylan 1,4-beta-xylosidase